MARKRHDPLAADRIIDSAIALWAEKGYESSTMRELGRRVGMGTSSLYGHFRSKEEIAQALYARLNEQALDAARQQSGVNATLSDGVATYLHIKLRILAQHRTVLATLLREAVDPDSALSPLATDSSSVRDTVVGHFEQLLRDAKDAPEGDTARLARLLWAGHLAVILYFCHDRSPQAQLSHKLVDTICNSLGLLSLLPNLPGASQILEIVDQVLRPSNTVSAHTPSVAPSNDRLVDVLIVGAGPIGCVLAGFLKRRRPGCKILVVDKSLEPSHKIGESTLSGFCKALRTIGVPHSAMQHLFHTKNGLGFIHLTEGVQTVQSAPEYILETFDETFQVERRPLELLLHQHLESMGIEVLLGAEARLADASLERNNCVVDIIIGGATQRVGARQVVDASGPASVLAKRMGLWTSDGAPFQTSASWGYWRGLTPLGELPGWSCRSQFPRQEYTQHLCFREGWMWVIPLVSWQQAPTRNLDRLIRQVRQPSEPHDRATLSARFGCPNQPLTSIGLVLREDRDQQLDPRDALETYRRRYPAIDAFLRQGELVSDPYGLGAPHSQRRRMRGHARQVSGDGWLLAGNAAFFVDPLISPGLTAGTACAWQAAKALDHALSSDDASMDHYERFVHELHAAHERDNQLVYMSFNHPQALKLVQRMQEVDARK
ncbi:MAG: flavin-dependent dehydrogenase/AcrR family transcriptional regulator, partial [Kiritimatiellia bacterium]